jgi:hypothetical protein
MVDAANARDIDALFENISEDFRSPQGKDKQQLREFVSQHLTSGRVQNAGVWNIEFEDRPSRERPPARVFFSTPTARPRSDLIPNTAGACGAFDYYNRNRPRSGRFSYEI